MNKPKQIGTAAERAVARFLQANGWPSAERRALRGRQDAGDITGTPGVCWEVKGGNAARDASALAVDRWLLELDEETGHAGADVGVLVLQQRGIGPQRAGLWSAVLMLGALIDLSCTGAPRPHSALALDVPVRMCLAHVVTILRAGGYGLPLEEEAFHGDV
ncbi:hypothetical protein [Actinomadura litoris]|uniref:hypothetical protein n=1 Tax=Actinomadura litoris TaxID=2678616 RepID=UPI001FA71850|nr:hypothetical protein [Actinomadura litoris]